MLGDRRKPVGPWISLMGTDEKQDESENRALHFSQVSPSIVASPPSIAGVIASEAKQSVFSD
jgi:hypothetical protein